MHSSVNLLYVMNSVRAFSQGQSHMQELYILGPLRGLKPLTHSCLQYICSKMITKFEWSLHLSGIT